MEAEEEKTPAKADPVNAELMILKLTDQMNEAARRLDFEQAAKLRDKIKKLRDEV